MGFIMKGSNVLYSHLFLEKTGILVNTVCHLNGSQTGLCFRIIFQTCIFIEGTSELLIENLLG